MKRGPTKAFEHGVRPSDYAVAWRQFRELQCWFSRELMRKYPDVDRRCAISCSRPSGACSGSRGGDGNAQGFTPAAASSSRRSSCACSQLLAKLDRS